jgi:hypothetical protein
MALVFGTKKPRFRRPATTHRRSRLRDIVGDGDSLVNSIRPLKVERRRAPIPARRDPSIRPRDMSMVRPSLPDAMSRSIRSITPLSDLSAAAFVGVPPLRPISRSPRVGKSKGSGLNGIKLSFKWLRGQLLPQENACFHHERVAPVAAQAATGAAQPQEANFFQILFTRDDCLPQPFNPGRRIRQLEPTATFEKSPSCHLENGHSIRYSDRMSICHATAARTPL